MALVCALMGTGVASALGSGTSAMGNIVLKNGREIDSVKFEMPLPLDKQVKVRIDGKKQKIATDSIDFIVVWHEKHPDDQHIFKPYRLEYIKLDTGESDGESDFLLWLTCDQVSPNASYWYSVGRPSFKRGKLVLNYNYIHAHESKAYVVKKGAETASHVPTKMEPTKKWAMHFFSDDPVVVRKLEADEYNDSDWGYKYIDVPRIVEDYDPQRK